LRLNVSRSVHLRSVAGARRAIARRIHGFRLASTSTARSDRRSAVATGPLVASTPPLRAVDPHGDSLIPFVPSRAAHEVHFAALPDVRLVQAGHNVPQEIPEAFAAAVLHANRNS
jgi:hypothetical protein